MIYKKKKIINLEINKFSINPESTINNALKKITKSGQRCVVVVNKNYKLLGVLADSDIRNALLKNSDLKKKIRNIFNKNPYIAYKNKFTYGELKNKIIDNRLGIVPIVDENKKLIDIFYLDKLKKINKKHNIPVVIMAGGKGTRLAPFTNILPKMLIPISDKPVIEHILDSFVLYGFHKFVLCINYKSEIIKSYFKEMKRYLVSFSKENKPLGTVGGIKKINFHKEKNIIVTNCDGIFDINFESLMDFHLKSNSQITLVASRKNIKIPYGVCQLGKSKNTLKNISEKPSMDFLVNTGLYVIKSEIIKLIPKNKYFDFTDLLLKAKKNRKKISVFPIDNKNWNDVGQWENLKVTQETFK